MELPDILKYKPKEFWNMLKQKDTNEVEISIAKFTKFTKDIFHNEDIPPDTYTPLTNPTAHHISPHELSNILRDKYNATKSRGLSKLPP
jgi:hypothetical protein